MNVRRNVYLNQNRVVIYDRIKDDKCEQAMVRELDPKIDWTKYKLIFDNKRIFLKGKDNYFFFKHYRDKTSDSSSLIPGEVLLIPNRDFYLVFYYYKILMVYDDETFVSLNSDEIASTPNRYTYSLIFDVKLSTDGDRVKLLITLDGSNKVRMDYYPSEKRFVKSSGEIGTLKFNEDLISPYQKHFNLLSKYLIIMQVVRQCGLCFDVFNSIVKLLIDKTNYDYNRRIYNFLSSQQTKDKFSFQNIISLF